MTVFSRNVVLCVAAALIAGGCNKKTGGQSPSASLNEAQIVSQTPEGTPPAATADTKAALDDVNRALAKNDIESATVSLVNLGLSGRAFSDAELIAYQSSMKNLQAQLADAAARNDPKANEMIRLLKASRGK